MFYINSVSLVLGRVKSPIKVSLLRTIRNGADIYMKNVFVKFCKKIKDNKKVIAQILYIGYKLYKLYTKIEQIVEMFE